MSKINELLQERAGLIEECRKLLDTSEKENRAFTAEEKEKYDRINAEVDALKTRADALALQEKREAEDASEKGAGKNEGPEAPAAVLTRAWSNYVRHGASRLTEPEHRALQQDLAVSGGYLIPPEFRDEIIKALDNEVFVRQRATVMSNVKSSLGVPALDADPADATWTAEIGSVTEDSAMTFGSRELNPRQLSQLLRVSEKLLMGAPNVEGLVRERLTYKFGTVQENTFLNGSGADEPLGLFTAGTNVGITTSRDVSTSNTTTEIRFDNLIKNKYNLKTGYRRDAVWIFHRDAVSQIRTLKDGNGQYIWQQGVVTGAPDTILGIPVMESEYAPNTFTTGQYVGVIGDLRFYWIADGEQFILKRLNELYAGNSQVGFVGRLYTDGMPVLEEAFSRVKLG